MGIGLAVLGLLLVGVRVLTIMKARISIPVFHLVLMRMCREGNLDRARKITTVVSGPYGRSVRAAFDAVAALGERREQLTVETTMTRAFDEELERQRPQHARTVPFLYAGFLVLAGAIAFPIPPWVYAAIGIGLVTAVWASLEGRRLHKAQQDFRKFAHEISIALQSKAPS